MQYGNWNGELQLQIYEKAIPTAENYFLIRDETGQPFRIGAIISDISERKRTEALITKQTADLQTVAELSTAVSTQLDTKKLLQDIVNRTKDSFNLYHVHIYLLDETGRTLQLAAGAGDVGAEMVAAGHSITYQHENSLVARAARSKQGVIVNDVTTDSGFLPNPLLPHTQSEMAVPMMAGNEVIGVLDIQADTTGYFTNADINIQTTLAAQIAVSLENARAFEQASEQAAIIQNTTSIIATFSLDGTFRFLNEAGLRRLGYDTLEDVIGKSMDILYPPSLGNGRREAITKIVQEEGVWQGEAILVTRSGEQFPVEQAITLSYDEDGQPKMLAFNMTDITVRKQAEEAQQALNVELEEQLERVNALHRAMTREGWRAFMTVKERPFQGFAFNREGVKPLTTQDLVSSTAAAKRDAEYINPVIIHGAAIGKIGIRNPNGEPLSEEQQRLLADFTNQVGEALDRARLFEETELGRQAIEQQAAELATVNEISELTRSYLQLDELITAVGDHLLKTFQAHSVYIALFDDQTDIITLPYFYDKENGHHTVAPYPLQDGGFTAQVIQSREPLLINSANSEEALRKVEEKGGKLVGSGRMTDTFVVVPMIVGAAVVGVIGISSYREIKTYDEDDKNLLITLSATIGIAIRNAQQFEITQRRANREALVNSISQKIQNSLTIEAAMQTAVAELGKALHIRKAAVALKTDLQNNGT
jgi:PAS domain S-box-containing protein